MARGDQLRNDGAEFEADREVREFAIESVTASEASWGHPDRNEDVSVGHLDRINSEMKPDSKIDVNINSQFDETDRQLVRDLAAEELSNINRLDELNVAGVLDGVSGTKGGEGMIASRLASAEISKVLAGMDEAAKSNPKQTKEALKAALIAANERVGAFKNGGGMAGEYDYSRNQGREKELAQTGCTAELMSVIETPDGRTEVAFAHAGDGALLHLDSTTGELKMMTSPQDVLSVAVQRGAVTEDERQAIMSRDDSKWPPRLANLKKAGRMLRQGMVSNINGKPLAEQIEETKLMLNLLAANGREAMVDTNISDEDVIQTGSFEVQPGDMVIPCSDGLVDNLPLDEIKRIITEVNEKHGGDTAKLSEILADEAARRGGYDRVNGKEVTKHPDAKGPDDITFEIISIPEIPEEELELEEMVEIDEGAAAAIEKRKAEEKAALEKALEQKRTELKEAGEWDIDQIMDDISSPTPEPPSTPEEQKKTGLLGRLFGKDKK
jgi:serine/threonine protein phosphatase PrpC